MFHVKQKVYWGGGILLILLLLWWLVPSKSADESAQIPVSVKRGPFSVLVTTTGELSASHSEKINGPDGLQASGIYQAKITDLIAEGTLVKAGDYVATLDRSEVENRLKDMETEYQRNESEYTKTRLDTTMQLRTVRNDLINMKYDLEEKKIVLAQSKFEPKATIRQAQINLDKAQRALAQSQKDYQLKKQQAKAQMKGVEAGFARIGRRRQALVDLLDKFVIRASKSGMVIYFREWNGTRRTVGSPISAWDPTVATLPDLSSMVSKTYVNEIDISKVQKGQVVNIGVDAFPKRKYTGQVISIANIGEQLPHTDAKVFEVVIQVNGSDSILRPAMTTSNAIVTRKLSDVLYIPLEALHNGPKGSYVYKKEGYSSVKQAVVSGVANENEVVITKGLEQGDKVLLAIPKRAQKMEVQDAQLWDQQDR